MAAMAADSSSSASASADGAAPAQTSSSTAVPSHNPLPLSASQEAQVRDIYYDRVRQKCSTEIKAFADCAMGRTFSVVFKCRDHNRAMNACLQDHATPTALDEAREEWFARRAERAAERRRVARRKAEQEKLLREWWGLEQGDGSAGAAGEDAQARRRRLERERMARPERVGGFPAKDRPHFEEESR